MSIPFSYHHHTTGSALGAPRSVIIDGRSFPASQPNMVAASLLARPDRIHTDSNPELTWSRP